LTRHSIQIDDEAFEALKSAEKRLERSQFDIASERVKRESVTPAIDPLATIKVEGNKLYEKQFGVWVELDFQKMRERVKEQESIDRDRLEGAARGFVPFSQLNHAERTELKEILELADLNAKVRSRAVKNHERPRPTAFYDGRPAKPKRLVCERCPRDSPVYSSMEELSEHQVSHV
jgi:hypothetical protein